ncbi:MAG: hypothetical protein ACI92I_000819, partial [Acidimicrobiales bacterium]
MHEVSRWGIFPWYTERDEAFLTLETVNFFKYSVIFVVLLIPSIPVQAQVSASLPCGTIIAPINTYDLSLGNTATPILDCTNPFSRTNGVVSPHTLYVDTVAVADASIIHVPTGGTNNFYVDSLEFSPFYENIFFLHDGNDYRYVNTAPTDFVEADYRAMAITFFSAGIDVEPYVQAMTSVDPGSYFTDSDQQRLLDDFNTYIYDNFEPTPAPLTQGVYTLVTKESVPILVENNFFQRLLSSLLPTANAQSLIFYGAIYTLTFEIQEPAPVPTGASSVLFLPGIMGSRLYEESDACATKVSEQERWVSINECDQLRLITNFTGASINDIYTKPGESSVIDEVYTFNLYKTFLQELQDWKNDGEIVEYDVVPYDWRLRLDNLLKSKLDVDTGKITYSVSNSIQDGYFYKTLTNLVDSSATGKVTIVAHSNGGLLAKTFLSVLQTIHDPLADKIDNLILVAVPQVGTPDAIVGMLQGSEIGGGFIASQEVTRSLLNTAPFGHHLLPNKNYFSGTVVDVKTPVILFKEGSITSSWREQFGETITTSEKLHEFLSEDSGRIKPALEDLSQPEVVDSFLLNYADTIAVVTYTWVPGTSTQVYQIAGTGVETPTGITYYTGKECVKGGYLWFECAEYKPKLDYYINFTYDGDETVVTPSALAMKESDNVGRLWLDLFDFADNTGKSRVHKNILEVPEVIDFIKNTVSSTTQPDYRYLSTSTVMPNIGKRLSFFLHSPLDMYLGSDEGTTSSSTSEIPGATYRRYGEVQYVSVPADTPGIKLYLKGYKKGSFTLVTEEWDGDTKIHTHDYQAVPTGSSTFITLALDSLSET